MVLIRPETPGDRDAIAEVNRLAFGGEEEVVLIERLRADRRAGLIWRIAAEGRPPQRTACLLR